jgi:hypothetical protein
MINLFNKQRKQAQPFVRQLINWPGKLVMIYAFTLSVLIWLGCQTDARKCYHLRAQWDDKCPGLFWLNIAHGNGSYKLLDSARRYQLPLKMVDNRGNPPERLVLDNTIYFIAKPGCSAFEKDLNGQIFRDTFYIWLPTPKGYDIDTLHLLYEFARRENCDVNFLKSATATYNGISNLSKSVPIVVGIKRK